MLPPYPLPPVRPSPSAGSWPRRCTGGVGRVHRRGMGIGGYGTARRGVSLYSIRETRNMAHKHRKKQRATGGAQSTAQRFVGGGPRWGSGS